MRMFLAGGVTGNLTGFWLQSSELLKEGYSWENAVDLGMQIFLAGGEGRHWLHDNLVQFTDGKCNSS